jgi:hypothetical protein
MPALFGPFDVTGPAVLDCVTTTVWPGAPPTVAAPDFVGVAAAAAELFDADAEDDEADSPAPASAFWIVAFNPAFQVET